ncbi:hypothetical protein J437_LFUL019179 [Ladona fulva]|uniref:ETFB lysine methyltransferase n=1 Tax=Ladona fulva TaxID=123851 RepID=A0A8K0P9Y7_LADFU|nr:hypothetical protein J437_LFUL019179 [Ladona fulva]
MATVPRVLRRLRPCLKRWNHSHSSLPLMRDLISRNTEITRNHLTPEIALKLITSSCPLWKAKPEECPFPDPFWAFYWPGGQAVTRFILDNPLLVRGLSVIDIGSGCGASAIAASKCGAKLAIANDIDPGIAAELNAALNNASICTSTENLIPEGDAVKYITKDHLPWDVIIVGDLFYDISMSQKVLAWVTKCASLGINILIGDPGRYAFTSEIKNDEDSKKENQREKPRLSVLARYPLPKESCLENNGFLSASVWRVN